MVGIAALAAPKPLTEQGRACGDIPAHYGPRTFKTFKGAYAAIDSPNFTTFTRDALGVFGHTFYHRLPQRKLAAQMAIYGYDYIGAYKGYLLFYRRFEGSWQPGGAIQLAAPNGELLPPIQLPSDLDPQWPAPGLVVSQAPFIGGIVLPGQIIAFPCT
jgi:hypothetical protein